MLKAKKVKRYSSPEHVISELRGCCRLICILFSYVHVIFKWCVNQLIHLLCFFRSFIFSLFFVTLLYCFDHIGRSLYGRLSHCSCSSRHTVCQQSAVARFRSQPQCSGTLCLMTFSLHHQFLPFVDSKNISVPTFISWRYSLDLLTAFPWSTQ